jgi:hypothetical protein
MTFWKAVRMCFAKYSDFSGTGSRSEYSWFVLGLARAVATASTPTSLLAGSSAPHCPSPQCSHCSLLALVGCMTRVGAVDYCYLLSFRWWAPSS